MKSVQILKKLNNTELGKGGTHDSYVLIPSELDSSQVFEKPHEPLEFLDRSTGEHIVVRKTIGREKRIVGLGQYYRSHRLSAGDEILFERQELRGEVRRFVSVRKHEDIFVFQKSGSGFELLTPERTDAFEKREADSGDTLEIRYLGSQKKRKNSPELTDIYDILISGSSLSHTFHGTMGELRWNGSTVTVTPSYVWKKYMFETEE